MLVYRFIIDTNNTISVGWFIPLVIVIHGFWCIMPQIKIFVCIKLWLVSVMWHGYCHWEKLLRIELTTSRCWLFHDVNTCCDFYVIQSVDWHVAWIFVIPNSIIGRVCCQQFFDRQDWTKLMFSDFSYTRTKKYVSIIGYVTDCIYSCKELNKFSGLKIVFIRYQEQSWFFLLHCNELILFL